MVYNMKTTAQLLRESMQAIATAQQAVTEAAPNYTFEWTVANPFEGDTARWPNDDEVPEEIEVGVVASIFGSDSPATFDSPAEYAEIEIEGVYDLETGKDITTVISPASMESVKDRARQYFDDEAESAEVDAEQDRAEAMRDRWYD